MYESSSCEPCAYEDGTQVHQLDGIAAQSEKKNSFKAARPVTEKKRFVLFIYIAKLFFFFTSYSSCKEIRLNKNVRILFPVIYCFLLFTPNQPQCSSNNHGKKKVPNLSVQGLT